MGKATKGLQDPTAALESEKQKAAVSVRRQLELQSKLDERNAELKARVAEIGDLTRKLDLLRHEHEQMRLKLESQSQQPFKSSAEADERLTAERHRLTEEQAMLAQQQRDFVERESQLAERERRTPELIAQCVEAEQQLQQLRREFDRAQQELVNTQRTIAEGQALLEQDLQNAANREAAVAMREQTVAKREQVAEAEARRLVQQAEQQQQREAACGNRELQTQQALAAAQQEALLAIASKSKREAQEKELDGQERRLQLRVETLEKQEQDLVRAEAMLRIERERNVTLGSQLEAKQATLAAEHAELELAQQRWHAEVEARARQAETAERKAQATAVAEAQKRCAELEARAQEQYEAHIKTAQDRARDLEQAAKIKHDELLSQAIAEDRRRREEYDRERAEREKSLSQECERRLQRAGEEAARLEEQAAKSRDVAEARSLELARQLDTLRTKERELEQAIAEQTELTAIATRRQKRIDQEIEARAAASVASLQAELTARDARLGTLEKLLTEETQRRQALDLLMTGAGNETLPKLRKQVSEAHDRIRQLEQLLRERPDEQETARLRERAGRVDILDQANAELQMQVAQLQHLRLRSDANQITQQGERAITEALRATNQALHQELDHLKQLVNQRVSNPLLAFQEVRRHTQPPAGSTGAPPRSDEFMKRIRHGMAALKGERARYYSESVVATFLAGLASTRIILLEGLSGTGKTSLPVAFAQAIGAGYEVIEVQSQWRDRGDLVGSYNPFHKRFYAQPFALALYKAGLPGFRERPFFIILDELNLAHVEHYFADILSLLPREAAEHRLRLADDPEALANAPFREGLVEDPRFGLALEIPPNVWFIGTANRDESTQPISDKVYDRAFSIELNRRADRFHADSKLELLDPVSFQDLQTLFRSAPRPTAEAERPVKKFLESTVNELERRFRITATNRFDDQWKRFLPVYVAAMPSSANGHRMGEAVDHFLATKLLRPLRERFDPNLEETLKELRDDTLADLWNAEAWGPFAATKSYRLLDEQISKRQGIGDAE